MREYVRVGAHGDSEKCRGLIYQDMAREQCEHERKKGARVWEG